MSNAVSTPAQPSPAAPSGKAELPRRFGFSALVTGLGRMWHGTVAALVVILVNAVVQAGLTWWNPQVGLSLAYIVALIVSTIFIVASFAILTRVCLNAVDGKVSLGAAIAGARSTLVPFVVWVLAQWIVITLGMMVAFWIGGLIAVLTPFIPLAAADGRGNAFGANFSAIKDRWGRWLITSIILSIGFFIWFLLSAFNVFFVKGMPASFVAWLATGILGWWILTAWAAIYRSTRIGAAGVGVENSAESLPTLADSKEHPAAGKDS